MTTISETDRQTLIAEIEAAGLESPEQVADMVLVEAEKFGLEAGRAKLAKCIRVDRPVTVYVVRDASGEYVSDASGETRTPASNEAHEFDAREEAQAACTRATDKVLSREVDE